MSNFDTSLDTVFNALTVTESGITQFKTVVEDTPQLMTFARHNPEMTTLLIHALASSGNAGKALAAKALSTVNMVEFLVQKTDPDERIMAAIAKLDKKDQAAVLSADNATQALSKNFAPAMVAIINDFEKSDQVAVLSSPNTLHGLMYRVTGLNPQEAETVTGPLMAMVKSFDPADQIRVLKAPMAGVGLRHAAADTVDLLKTFDTQTQVDILSTPRFLGALLLAMDTAVDSRLMTIFSGLKQDDQIKILCADGAGEIMARNHGLYLMEFIDALKDEDAVRILCTKNTAAMLSFTSAQDVAGLIQKHGTDTQIAILTTKSPNAGYDTVAECLATATATAPYVMTLLENAAPPQKEALLSLDNVTAQLAKHGYGKRLMDCIATLDRDGQKSALGAKMARITLLEEGFRKRVAALDKTSAASFAV